MGWGWNPQSFESIGTVAASLIAVVALIVALRQGAANRRNTDAALASAVSVTYEDYQEGQADKWNGIVLRLHNAGPLPIAIAAMAFSPRRPLPDTDSQGFHDVQVGRFHGRLYGRQDDVRLFCSGWERRVLSNDSSVFKLTFDPDVRIDYRSVGMCFLDANGLRWTRIREGRLIRGWGASPRAVRNLESR